MVIIEYHFMKKEETMLDFIKGALPFIIIGCCLLIIFIHYHKGKAKENKQNYLTEGMCIGLCLGVSLSSLFSINMGLGVSLGMLIGETIGILIKK